MKILKNSTFVFYFSGSVDTIVFSKTGNHLLQCLWVSNSFFTVDGCIDCVKGILNSQVSILWNFYVPFFYIISMSNEKENVVLDSILSVTLLFGIWFRVALYFLDCHIDKTKGWMNQTHLLTTITKALFQPSEQGMSLLSTCSTLTEESSSFFSTGSCKNTPTCHVISTRQSHTKLSRAVTHFQCNMKKYWFYSTTKN